MTEYGLFLEEGKTRFVAWVEVKGERRKAYVPTSTKLSQLLNPVGKPVELWSDNGHLEISCIKVGSRWIHLRSSYANLLMERKLRSQKPRRERTLNGYRFDLVTAQGVCYEVKSIITVRKQLWYPNASSARREVQLKKTLSLLKKGLRIEWAFVSLSPILQEILIDPEALFGRQLSKALQAGLQLSAWKIYRGSGLKRIRVVFREKQ